MLVLTVNLDCLDQTVNRPVNRQRETMQQDAPRFPLRLREQTMLRMVGSVGRARTKRVWVFLSASFAGRRPF